MLRAMNEGRRRQLEIFRAWSPAQRLARGMELTALCRAARDARLRLTYPGVSEEELRLIRAREALDLPHDARLP